MKPSNVLEVATLDSEWRDKDDILLHVCFQLLKNFVEKEPLFLERFSHSKEERLIYLGKHDQTTFEKQLLAEKEILELYDWWLSYTQNVVPDKDSYSVENDMLKRLINVRWALWT